MRLSTFIALIWMLGMVQGRAQTTPGAVDFLRVSSVAKSTTLNRTTRELTSRIEIKIENPTTATQAVLAPLHLIVRLNVTGGEASKIRVAGTLGGIGQPPYLAHYLDLTSSLTQGKLTPGQKLE